jgi:hypothetical protein
VGRRLKTADVIDVLSDLFLLRGVSNSKCGVVVVVGRTVGSGGWG